MTPGSLVPDGYDHLWFQGFGASRFQWNLDMTSIFSLLHKANGLKCISHSEDLIKFIIIIDGVSPRGTRPSQFFASRFFQNQLQSQYGCIYRLTEVRKFLPA